MATEEELLAWRGQQIDIRQDNKQNSRRERTCDIGHKRIVHMVEFPYEITFTNP